MNEFQFRQLRLDKDPISWLVNVLKNPKNPKNPYVKSVKILTNNFKYFIVGDIIEYWKNIDVDLLEKKLNEENWMYAYCILYGFRKNLNECDINIYYNKRKKSPEEAKMYLLSLNEMTEKDIKKFLINNPIICKNNIVVNGFHRVCAMIGRLVRNEKYIKVC